MSDDPDGTPRRAAGDIIVFADVIGTFAFAVTAVTAAVVFSTASQWVGAITAMALFAVGVFAFIWSFFNAVQRSREEQISVTQVYLLLGSPTPPRVRRIMLSMLVVQTAVGLATAIARSEADRRLAWHVVGGRRAGPDVRHRPERIVVRIPRCLPAPSRCRHFAMPRSTRMATMAETATEIITIDAPHERVWQIALDLESYPMWAHDMKDVTVRATDDLGRPLEVEFRASALGRSTHYTLKYDYTNAPFAMGWTMLTGDIQRIDRRRLAVRPRRRRSHHGALRPRRSISPSRCPAS